MNCGCIVDVDCQDAEGEVLESRLIIPPDGTTCVECGRPPEHGEQYLMELVDWGPENGGIEEFATCWDCKTIREELCCNFRYGNVLEDIEFELDDWGSEAMIPESCMEKLTPAARLMVAGMIDDAWGEEEGEKV